MIRKLGRLTAGVAAAAVAIVLTVNATSSANNADTPSILDIMEEGHSGKKSLVNQVKNAVKDEKWDDAGKPAAKLKTFGEALGKNTPEKGSKESWAKLTAGYKTDTAAIAAAVEKKDKAAAEAALAKLTKACQACHDVHQP